jgi:hypothetical protein
MDVINEIKRFEQHPERARFSLLQIIDFYKTLQGKAFTFEGMVSAVSKGADSGYEIRADTYAYSVQYNPVSEKRYLDWSRDMSFVCEADKANLKLNPITDLIKGNRIRCSCTFKEKTEAGLKVKLQSLEVIPYTEAEAEKEVLEKQFDSAHQERTVFAPQRQSQQRTFDRVSMLFIIGGILGGLAGMIYGAFLSFFDDSATMLAPGIMGVLIGGVFFSAVGWLWSLAKG